MITQGPTVERKNWVSLRFLTQVRNPSTAPVNPSTAPVCGFQKIPSKADISFFKFSSYY